MIERRRLIVGNWKMHGLSAALGEIAGIAAADLPAGVDVGVCPPFTLIDRAAAVARGTRLAIGAQDVHAAAQGAHTGCISVAMLADAGARLVIVGHSERRADNGETDADVRAKAEAALGGGLTTIVCVGETERQRDAGETLGVIGGQLAGSLPQGDFDVAKLVVAYEPVWAIGTGRTPGASEVAEVHAHIRAALVGALGADGAGVRILYGGSVKPDNAALLMDLPDVDGALVGGASLTAASFVAIVRA